jgi:phytoene dehydrogenase-like protein
MMPGHSDGRAADVLVVGGGHNGLIAAAYLARAGIDTLLLEARDDTGGCASTVDALGTRVNICSCDHIMVRGMPIYDELDLEAHGLRYLDLEPAVLGVRWQGGSPWFLFHDEERTLESLSRTHPSQVAGYRRYLDEVKPVAELVVAMAARRPSMGAALSTAASGGGRGLARLMRWCRQSAVSVLGRFFDDDDLMMPCFGMGPIVWGVDPHLPGTGLGALGYATKHLIQPGRPVGGSGALTDAIRSAFVAAGGEVRCGTKVASLLIAGDRAVGVRTTDGEEITAPRVLTACDPREVLAEWVAGDVPTRVRRQRDRWASQPARDGYESKIDALVKEPPVPVGTEDLFDGVDPTRATIVVGPAVNALPAMAAGAARGRVAADPVMMVNSPSRLDPTLRAADGSELVSLEVLWTPYAIEGGWEGSPEPERWLSRFAEIVQPGWLDGIVDWRVMRPVDYESQFNMRRGFTPSWSGTPLSVALGRPRELTRYRAELDGLYLCGAGTFPGAGIWGSSGRNAAAAMIGDMSADGAERG